MNFNASDSQKNIELLENICMNLNRYIPIIYLPIGITGNLLNILTFTRRSLRTNPCTIFLLYSSIANIFHLIFGLITRIIIDQFHYDIEGLSLSFCKLKYYIMYISSSLSLYFVLLASINRYHQSKSNSRQWCCIRFLSPHQICLLIIGINCLIYVHIPILFHIQRIEISSKSLKLICYASRGPYRIFLDVYLIITWSLLSPCLMLCFGLLTIRNLRVIRMRAFTTGSADSNNHHHRRNARKKIDVQLVFMLFLQIIVIFCSTLPFGIQKLVSTFNPAETAYRLAVEEFVLCVTRLISFTNSTFCFFFYILTAQKFRSELSNCIQQSFSWLITKIFFLSICYVFIKI